MPFKMRQALQLWPVHDSDGKQVSAALISATLHDGVVAAAVVLAMYLGVIVPKPVLDGLSERATRRTL
jgi:hypothetical protein